MALERNNLVAGILAHVDAGKTTLSEALLYRGGALKKLGRVDHQDAFLDTDTLERERGITIFSKQAMLSLHDLDIQLLDTPGHVDFSSEMERTLQALDCAILVISGSDGVQGHTETVWRLLARYRIPTFLFINKMDLPGVDREARLSELRNRLSDSCVDLSAPEEVWMEQAAMCSEDALESYLDTGRVEAETVAALIAQRKLFPCYFGSALKLDGVDEFLAGLEKYARAPDYPAEFGARVYKIGRDSQGARLTYLKVTGGSLRVKAVLTGGGEDPWEEKADQLRIYSGAKYRLADTVPAGTVCAVTGLTHTFAGQGLGREEETVLPVLTPVLTYQVKLPEGCDPHVAMGKLSQLEEEDPQLHIVWNERLRQIQVQLMGQVQLEVLQRLIGERFGMAVTFGTGAILYRETITRPAEGVGHFEPLRHYAEVHLLLEPGERGSGLRFETACGQDQLDLNWQRLILTHLEEKTHLGVLTGSPLTDVKITLLSGKAHVKHTEGGDFRQATYRAVRQGLMQAGCQLLEPWYSFRLEVPADQVGRAMSDLQRFSATFEPPETAGEMAVLTGEGPVSTLGNYGGEVAAYTRGRGRFSCTVSGYQPCHDPEEVIAASGYDWERDVENTPDSVFCGHGAGFVVKWDQVEDYMHLPRSWQPEGEEEAEEPVPAFQPPRRTGGSSLADDKELAAIFERTYGPIKRKEYLFRRAPQLERQDTGRREIRPRELGEEYLLVDGYNIIFAWEDLKAVAKDNLDAARQLLMDLLCNYQGFRKCHVILVFDAYKVPRNAGEVVKYHNIHVVYTKEAETADTYIERATYEIAPNNRVRVATSDGTEQLIILGHGALRLSASNFRAEVEEVGRQIARALEQQNRGKKTRIGEGAVIRTSEEK